MEPFSGAPPRSGGWKGCAVAVLVLIVATVVFIPGLLSSGRASNEMNARASIRTIVSAELDFRANDRDGNRVNDFWTGDVKGLYTMTSADEPGTLIDDTTDDPPLGLIELSIACADADGTLIPAGGENHPFDTISRPSDKSGYWYAVLSRDRSVSNPAESSYKTDTGGTPPMGKCHHLSKFGFVAFPDSVASGKYAFIVNESNACYRSALTSAVRTGTSVPPGMKGFTSPYRDWPDARTLDEYWSKTD
jgi:hypothetical protein